MTIPGIFSQTDSRWSALELGYNGDPYYNLYHFGCLVTAVSNMLWWNGNAGANPGAVNQWLIEHGGFEAGGGNLIWSALRPLLEQVDMVERGYSTDLNAVNAFLQDENSYAIVWITKPGFPMHFSAMPYVGQIADSWDAQLKPVGTYTFHGAHLYSKNAHVVVPAPAPEPTPVAAPTIEPPIVDPTPAPTPSVDTPVPDPNISVPTPVDEVPIRFPEVGNPVLEDLPPQPEFEETYRPFAQVREIHLKEDSIAVDATGANPPKAIFANRPMLSSGTFMDNGRKYYRGTSGGWYGVQATDVIEEDELPAASPTEPVGPSVWSILAALLKDPLGALIRLISRLHP